MMVNATRRTTNAPRRSAYTMIELVFGMATSTILLGALTSTMIVAAKALPDSKSAVNAALEGAATADLLASDLFSANTILTRTPHKIEFRVADRNNDGCPETIVYEWSGNSGDPLKRKYNDALPLDALTNVYEFELDYETALSGSSVTPAANESDEVLLASNVGSKYRTDWALTNTAWVGQFFRPTLPANSTSWKVTRVELLLRANGANDGIARIELRYPDASFRPTGALIADAHILERELSTGYLWRTFKFTTTPALSSTVGAGLVVKWLANSAAVNVQYQTSKTVEGDNRLLSSSNAGSTWTTATNQGLLFKVYGTATAATKPVAVRQYSVNAINIRLRSGPDDSARVETAVPLPNEPEVTGA
jgi:hypothetical protein